MGQHCPSSRASRSASGSLATFSGEARDDGSAGHGLLVQHLTIVQRGERVPFVSRDRVCGEERGRGPDGARRAGGPHGSDGCTGDHRRRRGRRGLRPEPAEAASWDLSHADPVSGLRRGGRAAQRGEIGRPGRVPELSRACPPGEGRGRGLDCLAGSSGELSGVRHADHAPRRSQGRPHDRVLWPTVSADVRVRRLRRGRAVGGDR
jgi:hypothetical protein